MPAYNETYMNEAEAIRLLGVEQRRLMFMLYEGKLSSPKGLHRDGTGKALLRQEVQALSQNQAARLRTEMVSITRGPR